MPNSLPGVRRADLILMHIKDVRIHSPNHRRFLFQSSASARQLLHIEGSSDTEIKTEEKALLDLAAFTVPPQSLHVVEKIDSPT